MPVDQRKEWQQIAGISKPRPAPAMGKWRAREGYARHPHRRENWKARWERKFGIWPSV